MTVTVITTRIATMARWKPGAKDRLQEAALTLFAANGFEQTTAAEIAQAVGLTERTFFRHFSDKREVLFHGQDRFEQAFLDGMAAAPPEAPPWDLVARALQGAATMFPQERREHSRLRQSVIDRNPALQEREAHKMSTLAVTIVDALHQRGIADPAARLAADSATTVFGIAFLQWIGEGEERSMATITADVLNELRSLTAGAPPSGHAGSSRAG